MKVFSL